MKEPTEMGLNRTGIGTSPIDSKELEQGAEESIPSSPGDESALAEVRLEYASASGPVGTMPPPTSVKGAVRSVLEGITKNPGVFLDKLGERLAFERTGTRLYEGILAKYDALGSFAGGPSRELIVEFHDEELQHFQVLKSAIESMGADPTAVTPSADVTAVEAMGLVQVINDPRTTLVQTLHAMLIAELADSEGWDMLVELATALGHDAMADDFRDAMRAEERHLGHVRQWVANFTMADAEGQLEKAA
jgi:hypothetical protein